MTYGLTAPTSLVIVYNPSPINMKLTRDIYGRTMIRTQERITLRLFIQFAQVAHLPTRSNSIK